MILKYFEAVFDSRPVYDKKKILCLNDKLINCQLFNYRKLRIIIGFAKHSVVLATTLPNFLSFFQQKSVSTEEIKCPFIKVSVIVSFLKKTEAIFK